MEKVKLNIEMPEVTWVNIDDICQVADRIPYEEKEKMAEEIIQRTLVIDDKNGVTYYSKDSEVQCLYLVAKYYTNIDLDECEDLEKIKKLYDFMMGKDGLGEKILRVANDDLRLVKLISGRLKDAIEAVYKNSQSLTSLIKRELLPLISNEGAFDLLAKAESTTDTMKKMYDAYVEKERQETTLKSGKASKMKVGGAVLNLAKK